jgi:hypothetical protein
VGPNCGDNSLNVRAFVAPDIDHFWLDAYPSGPGCPDLLEE